jgi:hypothetical protein
MIHGQIDRRAVRSSASAGIARVSLMDEQTEIRRMLLQFKADLPPHDLSEWKLQAQPLPPAIEIEGGPIYPFTVLPDRTRYRIEGWANCARCGQRFSVPSIGNASTIFEEDIQSTAEKMKEWVRREATLSGPCWGDVPKEIVRDVVPMFDSAGGPM